MKRQKEERASLEQLEDNALFGGKDGEIESSSLHLRDTAAVSFLVSPSSNAFLQMYL